MALKCQQHTFALEQPRVRALRRLNHNPLPLWKRFGGEVGKGLNYCNKVVLVCLRALHKVVESRDRERERERAGGWV